MNKYILQCVESLQQVNVLNILLSVENEYTSKYKIQCAEYIYIYIYIYILVVDK